MDERLTASGNLTLDGFADLLQRLLTAAWGEDWGLFTEDEPTGTDPEEINLPRVVMNLVRRVPSEAMHSPKPRLMEQTSDPEYPEHSLSIYRQWFDCTVSFACYAATSRAAAELAERLEDFLFAYTGFFKEKGISEILFLEEQGSAVTSQARQNIPCTVLTYLIRLERIHAVRSHDLVQLYLKVNSSQETTSE